VGACAAVVPSPFVRRGGTRSGIATARGPKPCLREWLQGDAPYEAPPCEHVGRHNRQVQLQHGRPSALACAHPLPIEKNGDEPSCGAN
jgi:hypothetical protein